MRVHLPFAVAGVILGSGEENKANNECCGTLRYIRKVVMYHPEIRSIDSVLSIVLRTGSSVVNGPFSPFSLNAKRLAMIRLKGPTGGF